MSEIRTIIDNSDGIEVEVAPRTLVSAIKDGSDNTLQTLLDNKQNSLISGTNIKTINNNSILGPGNISIVDGEGSVKYDEVQSLSSSQKLQARTNINSQVQILNGSVAPTIATFGELGQLYLNTTDSSVYICIAANPQTGYDWRQIATVGDVSTWEDVQYAIQNGFGETLFPVGTTFTINIDGLGDTIWTVMRHITNGHDGAIALKNNKQYGMILQSRDVLYYGYIPFDPKEAFYYTPTQMSPGTYNFLLGQHSWVSADVGKYFQFTVTNTIPANAQFEFQQNYNVTLANASVKIYASGLTTVIETVTLTEGQGGTYLGELRNNFSGNFNSCQRAFFGNNRWKESFDRQFLNNDSSGNWWIAQNNWDRPNSNQSNSGFMYRLPSDFKAVISEVDIDTILNNVCDGGGKETTSDKIFLPSRKEVYCTAENAYDLGTAWDKYVEDIGTASPTDAATNGRIKYMINTEAARYYWLRTPYTGYASYTRYIGTTGVRDYSGAYYSGGLAPACIIA